MTYMYSFGFSNELNSIKNNLTEFSEHITIIMTLHLEISDQIKEFKKGFM